ncbi:hypothetical protein DPEC_G00327550 [Dallia pectoralis]|uniref:Uncharacterized protein n=1 Tax=Dallia pectoralis TaxID=75939 RepID=A0ACC2F8G6_DALPE|nr:hypothetical protein DPEC_G00327550 [Dallia pectoralis]
MPEILTRTPAMSFCNVFGQTNSPVIIFVFETGEVLHLYEEVRSASEQDGKGGLEEEAGVPGTGSDPPSAQNRPAGLLTQLAGQTKCQTPTEAPMRQLAHNLTHTQSPSRHTVSFQLHQSAQSPPNSKRKKSPASITHSPGFSGMGWGPVQHNASYKGRVIGGHGQRSVVTFSYIEKADIKTVESLQNLASQTGSIVEGSTSPSLPLKTVGDHIWLDSNGSPCRSSLKIALPPPGGRKLQQQEPPGTPGHPILDPVGRAATQRALEEFGFSSPLLRSKIIHGLEQSPRGSRHNQSWACGSPARCHNGCNNFPNNHSVDADRNRVVCGPIPRSPASNQLSSHARKAALGMSPKSRPRSCAGAQAQSPQHWASQDNAGSPTSWGHKPCNSNSTHHGAILQLGNKLEEEMVLNQLNGSTPCSPTNSPEVTQRLAQEASKVSSILSEVRRNSLTLHNALDKVESSSSAGLPGEANILVPNAHRQDLQHQQVKLNIPLPSEHTPASDDTDSHQAVNLAPHTEYNNFTVSTNHGTQPGGGRALPQSSILSDAVASEGGSPGLPSLLLRPTHPAAETSSPLRDPRLLRAQLRVTYSPRLHRCQPPQYTGDLWSFATDGRVDSSSCERGDSAELARRLYIGRSVEDAPVSWTSRLTCSHPVVEECSSSASSPGHKPVPGQQALSMAQLKRAEQRRREVLLLGPVVLDSPEEEEGLGGDAEQVYRPGPPAGLLRVEEPPEGEPIGVAGSSSRSSSGVTGSLWERDCLSPESSQSSHQSNETGAATSGIQTDSVSAVTGPSLHSQKIARAKWEFLFGTPAEEAASRGQKGYDFC